MKVIVTVATGFIGSSLVEKLICSGYNVIVLGRNIEKAIHLDWYKSVTFIKYEIGNKLSENIINQISGVEKLIHLSWSGLPNYNSITHIEDNLIQQYDFIKQIILSGINDITINGTCLEYGYKNGPLDP